MTRIHAAELVDVFGKKVKQTREETTDSVARSITREESTQREALTAKLKAARLEHEAMNPPEKPAKRLVKRKPPLRKY